jgi:hypothetical protein
LPQSLYEAAKKSSRIAFFCPYGHEAVFNERDTEADVLRRERDLLKQQLAQRDDEIVRQARLKDAALKEARALKTSAVKAKKRTAAGLCPCCNRSFRQMALHLKTKHPNFRAEEVA